MENECSNLNVWFFDGLVEPIFGTRLSAKQQHSLPSLVRCSSLERKNCLISWNLCGRTPKQHLAYSNMQEGSEQIAYLSWQSSRSCRSMPTLGSFLAQYWHCEGSSDTAFSTARFREHCDLLISMRQLGHVDDWSLRRASAKRWAKQPAHIRCPLVHWNNGKTQMNIKQPFYLNYLFAWRAWHWVLRL